MEATGVSEEPYFSEGRKRVRREGVGMMVAVVERPRVPARTLNLLNVLARA